MFRIQTFILATRIWVSKKQLKSWKISTQQLPKSEEYHIFVAKILNFNIKLKSNITVIFCINIFSIEKKVNKKLVFSDPIGSGAGSGSVITRNGSEDPDQN